MIQPYPYTSIKLSEIFLKVFLSAFHPSYLVDSRLIYKILMMQYMLTKDFQQSLIFHTPQFLHWAFETKKLNNQK